MRALTKIGIVGIVLMTLLSLSTLASAANVEIAKVEVNGVDVVPGSTNKLDIERGETFDVKVQVKSLADQDNVEILAMITGYEFNDIASDRMSDNSEVVKMEANTSYVRTLELKLPYDVDVDSYKLRVLVSDRNGQLVSEEYNLQISTQRHNVAFRDVMFVPGTNVDAGKAVLAKVRLYNLGQKTEQDVKVSIAIPALGVKATDYIDEIKADKQDETEELYLSIPASAETGEYAYTIDVAYSDGRNAITKAGTIAVKAKEKPAAAIVNTTPVQTQPAQTTTQTQATSTATKDVLKKVLEGVLLILVVLLVIIGLIIGFSKLSNE